MSTRVLIAEDETIIRIDIAQMLVAAAFDACGEARDGNEVLSLARELEPGSSLHKVKLTRIG